MAGKVKLTAFLKLVRSQAWRSHQMPTVWNEQLRQSLNDGLVKVGWASVLELTPAGRAHLASSGKTGE